MIDDVTDLATIQELSAAGRHQECLQACQNGLQTNPEATFAYKYAGKSLLALGQFEKAQQCLVKAHQLDGKDPEIVKDIGNIFLKLGNKDTALGWYEKALEIDNNYAPAFNNIANLKRQSGNTQEAIDLFTRAIQADPKLINAYVGAAASFLAIGDLDQAEALAAQALAINLSVRGANEILGIVYQNKSKPEQAIECYQKELEVNPKASNSLLNLGLLLLQKGQAAVAVESLSKASALAPSQQCSLLLAQAYQNLGQFKEAIVEYKKLDINQSKNKIIPFNVGLCLLNTGNNIDAIEAFKITIQLDESFTPAWGNIGTALMNEGRHQEALQATQKVLILAPYNPDAHMNLGQIYKELGQLDQALAATLKSLELKPDNPDALMNLGGINQELGQLDQALAATLKSLELKPDHPTAHMNLGGIYKDLGQLDQALTSTLKSLELKPDNPDTLMNLGGIYKDLEQLDQALTFTLKSLELKPDNPVAHMNLGGINQELGQLDQALAATLKSLELKPDNPDAHINLGGIYKDLGQLDQALAANLKSLELKPDNPTAHINLGQIYKDLGQLDHALAATIKSLELNPDNPAAHINLGGIYKALGQLDQALTSTLKSLELNPDNPDAHMNLGGIYKDLGLLDQALTSTLKSLELKPDNPDAHMNLGWIYKELGLLDQALAATLNSLELKPDNPVAHMNLGGIYKDLGQLDQALASYRRANVLKPRSILLAAATNLFFSDLHKDNSEIDKERTAYIEGIKELKKNATRFERSDKCIPTDMFWIAYHNREDDKDILESLGRSLQPLQSQNQIEKIISKKEDLSIERTISLGICSDFLKSHTIGKLYSELVKALKRRGFRLTIFRGPGAKTDALSQEIDEYANASIRLPESLKEACSIVSRAELDILFYPDIGMSPYTYTLAMNRLAPVQVTSWGHPNTAGLQTMDYFLSSSLIEPQNAQSNYTERLIQLAKLPCVYPTPRIRTEKQSRSKFTLPLDPTLIGIPQSLFKFHPDYDEVLERIISKLPKAKYVLIEGTNKLMTQRLKSRWEANAQKTLANSIFLPRMTQKDYLCLLETVDILLDPIYFGSGNTFYEAMAIGTPLVTMPGAYMRGRIVAGGYKQMKLDNAPIANDIDDYIEITISLAEDADLRRSLKKQIKTSALMHLFDDQEAANEIIEFIHAAIDENRKTGCLLPVDWTPSKNCSL